MLTGVVVNAVAVIIGSVIGLLFRKGVPERFSDAIMKGVALCVLYIGISGSLKGEQTIVVILSVVIGAVIGTLLDIDGFITRLGDNLEKRFASGGEKASISQGFVTASLLFCVGAMTIVGSLTVGLTGDNEMLFTKSVLDFISSIMLTVSLGLGVMFSSAFVLVFQGSIALLAGFLSPIFSESAINETVCAGSILIIGLSLNMLGITKIKVANYMPALLVAPLIIWILEHI